MRFIGWAAAVVLAIGCGGGSGGTNGNSNDGSSATSSKGNGKDDGGNATSDNKGGSGGDCKDSGNACPDGCNPCMRLSDAEVAKVVGKPAVKGQWDGDACLWDFLDAQGDPSFEVGFHINTDYATFVDECYAPSSDEIMITPVSGVGDDACYITTSIGSLGSFALNFLKGCWAYSISIAGPALEPSPFSDATAREYEKALAKAVVPNL